MIKVSIFIKNLHDFIFSLMKYLIALLELLLAIRLILKFLGASSKAIIVDSIYSVSGVFTAPFNSIFPNIPFKGGVIDIVAISAMIGYLILVLIVLKLLDLIFSQMIDGQ